MLNTNTLLHFTLLTYLLTYYAIIISWYLQRPYVEPSFAATGHQQQSTRTKCQWRHRRDVTLQRPH